MKIRFCASAGVITGICLCVGFGSVAYTQTHSPTSGTAQKEPVMTTRATGPFDVKITPQPLSEVAQDPTLGRMSIDKQYHGDLEGTGKGEMLTAGTSVKGSGAYVAVERFNGKLRGRSGTFALQHMGTMAQGTPHLSITVVPDSGTDQLTGLTGKMEIIIKEGKHSYDFEYTLPEAPK